MQRYYKLHGVEEISAEELTWRFWRFNSDIYAISSFTSSGDRVDTYAIASSFVMFIPPTLFSANNNAAAVNLLIKLIADVILSY